jgi:hypothetical protein
MTRVTPTGTETKKRPWVPFAAGVTVLVAGIYLAAPRANAGTCEIINGQCVWYRPPLAQQIAGARAYCLENPNDNPPAAVVGSFDEWICHAGKPIHIKRHITTPYGSYGKD